MLSQNKQGSMDKFVGTSFSTDLSHRHSFAKETTQSITIQGGQNGNEVRVKNLKGRIEHASSVELPEILSELKVKMGAEQKQRSR